MLPLRDDNPTHRMPVVTILLILACVGVFFFVQPSGRTSILGEQASNDAAFTVQHAAIPCEIVQGRPLTERELTRTFGLNEPNACDPNDRTRAGFPGKQVYLAILLSMFMHGGLLHIAGNMLYFWIFGNNIEDRLGPLWYALFYLAGGVFATFGHIVADPDSTVPVVGASGAIAAVMGAYLALYPRHRVHSLLFLPPFFVFFRPVRAWLLLGFWFVSQFFVDPASGVAWVAHVAGFVFGVVVGALLRAARAGNRPEWSGVVRV